MKQLTCEMCGSTDLLKQDGVFVCQTCGCKYSAEEAKKMMVEGVIEVQGTVKVDSSDELSNLYQIARRAKNDDNVENAAKYYDMILVKDPMSWEASFYLVYFKAMDCRIAEIQLAGISVSNCIESVLKLIKDNVEEKSEQIKAVQEVAMRCTQISSFLYNGAKSHYEDIDIQIRNEYLQSMVSNCSAAKDIMYVLGDSIDVIFDNYSDLCTVAVDAWKEGITKHNGLMKYFDNQVANKSIIMDYTKKIQKYDSAYIVSELSASNTSTETASGGCYIATAVYGSYDCPEVWTLRRYRDNQLSKTWYGRLFIHIYYAISPTIVKWFGGTEWFKKMWKGKLDNMVKNLQSEGVESTPYEDRNW